MGITERFGFGCSSVFMVFQLYATTDDDELTFIRLDPTLAKFYERELTSTTASRYGVQYVDDIIMIPYSKMKEIFQPAVSGILSCMNSALSASPVSIDTILFS